MNMNEFLDGRGLDPELAARMGWAEVKGRAGAAVGIPYLRNGDLLGRKYRLIGDKRFFSDPGWERDLWNVDVLRDETIADQPVIIAEGEMDALSCIQAGFVRSVSIPDGWSANFEVGEASKSKPLYRNLDALKAAKVIVAGDNDEVGASFVRYMANLLDEQDVRWVKWPDGCKDANDTLRQHGEAAVVECVQAARPVNPEGGIITGISDLPPMPPRRLFRTGHDKLDRHCAFEPGTLSVLTGIPGHGKSTWATWLAWSLSRRHNIRCGLLMMETNPLRIRTQLSLLETGRRFNDLTLEEIQELDARFRIMQRDDDFGGAHNMGWLKQMVRTAAMRDGCKFIVIDPWNELEHYPEPGESLTNYTNAALTAIRQWAQRYDVHIMVTAHPRKMLDGERIPVGYDIADSAAWVNKPAIGLSIHKGDEVTVTNWKVRDREFYECWPGKVEMEFDAAKLCYRETL